jgi:hypothetical protein
MDFVYIIGRSRKVAGPSQSEGSSALWRKEDHRPDRLVAGLCCVSFSDNGRNIEDQFGMIEGRIIVYRISDGAWFPLARIGGKGRGTSARFGWFYDYKEFLKMNETNQAKREGQRTPALE